MSNQDNPNNPFHPIIYVRGYAMTPNEIDETTADPFCGFNLGSTIYRAVSDRMRQPRKYIFQSPVVRLASDFKYENVYQDGCDILDLEWESDAKVIQLIINFRAVPLLSFGITMKLLDCWE